MKIVFMGTPGLAVPCLERLVLENHKVIAVYTQPDRPAGRGRSVVFSPVKKAALALGIPVFQPESLKNPDVIAGLAGLRPDAIVVAAYGQILPRAVLDIPPRGCLNVHFSLLPRHRGAAPVMAAILAGDDFTGVSIMLIDVGLDTGPVLARAAVSISAWDTTASLTAKLAQVGSRFLPEVLNRWERGQITPQKQDESQATYFRPIAKESGEIDWSLPAVDIWRRVRAFYPWPGAYTRWRGQRLQIIDCEPLPGDGDFKIGQVIEPPPGAAAAFGVKTGAGILGVLRLQFEGKQAMPAADFLRGQREFIGSVLPG